MEKKLISPKNTAAFLLMCILTAFFLSVIYIELNVSHDCSEHVHVHTHVCSVCENLNHACKILKYLGMWVKSVNSIAIITLIFLSFFKPFTYSLKKHTTLVSLKVRLDN